MVVLGAVTLGGGVGLLLTDANPSAAYVASPPSADPEIAVTSTHLQVPPTTAPDRSVEPAAETVDPSAPDGEAWASVLGRLDAVRSDAFGLGDLRLLASVYVDGSDPLERDAAALAELNAEDVRAVELRLVVDGASVVHESDDEVVLRVVDRMPGYQLVRSDGSVAESRPGRGAATWLVTLQGGPGDWRIAAITAD